ncbi:breast cancer associated RING 1 isoform X2 [Wolffia australiana]
MVNIYKSMSVAFKANLGLVTGEANWTDDKRFCGHDYGIKFTEEKSQTRDVPEIITTRSCHSRDGIHHDQAQCSPPSSAGLKYSDDDSTDRGSALGLEMQDIRVSSPRSMTDLRNRKSDSQPEEGRLRDPKKRRFEVDHARPVNPTSKAEVTDNGINNATSSIQLAKITSNEQFACAFCQCSQESEASGPLLHYADGEPVEGDQARKPHVMHVHQKCVEWAPQVFFDEDCARNLEAEISRASKIKCTKCGKKGAALGCYSRACRKSYHVPCAVETAECRWDCVNYLLLCPSHADRELPCDKSYGRKSGNRASHKSKNDNEIWVGPTDETKEWVLCGSALSAEEREILSKFASMIGATLTKDWRSSVTHVIASTDQSGACSRTLKFLMAILSGKWVVSVDWIKACLDARHPVAEDRFEISHDIHGCFDGPKNGRTRVLEQAPKLFSGLSFFLTGDFMPTYKGYLKDLIFAAGGELLEDTTKIPSFTTAIVVYSLDSPQNIESSSSDDVMSQRFLDASELAAFAGSRVAPHTWILDSIAACKVLSLSL